MFIVQNSEIPLSPTFAAMNKSSSVIAIVQARMGSQRLPGKVLMSIEGRKVIDHLLDALLTVLPKEKIRIATSTDSSSDLLAEYLLENDWAILRGDEENVAWRFSELVKQKNCSHFFRLSGDSPLFDPKVLEEMLAISDQGDYDLITTVSKQPYPSGCNAEFLKASTFLEQYPHFHLPGHFEHVTRYFYENKAQFNLQEVLCPIKNARQHKFTLDTPEDKKVIETLFAQMEQPHYTYSLLEKCQLYQKFILRQS